MIDLGVIDFIPYDIATLLHYQLSRPDQPAWPAGRRPAQPPGEFMRTAPAFRGSLALINSGSEPWGKHLRLQYGVCHPWQP